MREIPSIATPEERRRKVIISEAMKCSVTAQEYAERRSDFPDPYVEIVEANTITIVCFGANHQNDPLHPQMEQIKGLIDTHQPELVLVEGMRILEDKDRLEKFKSYVIELSYEEAAIRGEAFLTTWYAIKNAIQTCSPEPSYEKLFSDLETAGHDKQAILLEKLLSLYAQWQRENTEESLNHYAEPFKSQWAKILGFPTDMDVLEQCELLANTLGIPLNQSNIFDETFINELQDPIPWEGKTMYPTNFVAKASSAIRDRMILERMYDEMKKGTKKQLIVFGASHLHMQVPAIRKLVALVAEG
jgi:hypothetical protein